MGEREDLQRTIRLTITHMWNEATACQKHLRLAQDIYEALRTRGDAAHLRGIAGRFFEATLVAHRDVAVLRLCRLVDRHRSKPNTIWRLLELARNNAGSFGSAPPKRIQQRVAADERRLKHHEAVIKALNVLRDKVLAHNDTQAFTDPVLMSGGSSVSLGECWRVLKAIQGMLACYSSFLNETEFSFDTPMDLDRLLDHLAPARQSSGT